MAFQIAIDLGNGVVTNLHVVEEITLDYTRKVTRSTVHSYVEKEFAEKAGNTTIQSFSYEFPGLPPGDPLDFVYSELKKRDEWSTAGEVDDPIKPQSAAAFDALSVDA